MNIVHMKINGKPVEIEAGSNILAAAKKANVNIPTLCYHPDLPAWAACGLCVVKQEKSPKLLRACATPVQENLSIITHDAELYQIRKTVIEMILSTHPNDCLMCARNGSCELQRFAAEFGVREQPYEVRVVDLPKDTSTTSIVLDPSKCIKCGRCVQVCQDMQGVFALEFIGRGDHTVVSPAANLPLNDSPCIKCGQCAAHCPVGAIYEKDEIGDFVRAVSNPDLHVVTQIAPAVRVALGESFNLPAGTITTGKIYAALRHLGVSKVFDTNFSADLTIMEEATEFLQKYRNFQRDQESWQKTFKINRGNQCQILHRPNRANPPRDHLRSI